MCPLCWLVWSVLGLAVLGCHRGPPPRPELPSILLVTVEGWSAATAANSTNAALDAFATAQDWQGRAIVSSSEPLASLASIHTGLGVWHHQLLASRMAVEQVGITTLAERLSGLGYDTVARVPLAFRRRHLLSAGFARFGDPAELPTVVTDSSTVTTRAIFEWLHLVVPRRRGRELSRGAWADRVGQRLAGMLPSLRAASKRPLVVVVVGAQGWPTDAAPRLDRSAVEVPLLISLPSALSAGLAPRPYQRVAATRLWATLVEVAGGKAEPGRAPSLFYPLEEPVLSELYFSGESNHFSLVDGDFQLLWLVRYTAAADSQRSLSLAQRRRGFLDTQPLYGAGVDPPQQQLQRWTETGSEPVDDPQRHRQLAAELERIWLRHSDPRQTPRDVVREMQQVSDVGRSGRSVDAPP